MRLELALFSTSLTGLLCCAVAVNGFFDGQLSYCEEAGQRCQHLPDWIQLNQSVTNVQRTPGMAPWKILGAMGATAAFSVATLLARKLVHIERENLALGLLQTELKLRKAGIQAHIDLEAFRKQALLESAEAAYAVFEPYLEPDPPLIDGVDAIDPATKLTAGDVTLTQDTPAQPDLVSRHHCQLFDWRRLGTHPDEFAHIRIIGKTGRGKTVLADWLLDVLGGQRFVITIKRKPKNWQGLKVYGLTRDYEAIRNQLKWVLDEMDARFNLIEKGIEPEIINFAVDEWRSISQNVKQLKDPQTGELLCPSAKEMMKEIITLARDAKLRMIALAQGKQVKTWGLEDESDLEECFTTIRLGHFAVEHAQALRNACRKDSEEYSHWTAVLKELADQGERCCMVEQMPARVPDLSNWFRCGTESGNWVERTREMLEDYFRLEGLNQPPSSAPDEDEDEDLDEDEQSEQTHLSLKAQKLYAYLQRRTQKTGQTWIAIRDVQRSEPIKGIKSDEVKALFDEIVAAGKGILNQLGELRLL